MRKIFSLALGLTTGAALIAVSAPLATYHWWISTPPKEPTYDSSIRAPKEWLLPTICLSLAAIWVLANVPSAGALLTRLS